MNVIKLFFKPQPNYNHRNSNTDYRNNPSNYSFGMSSIYSSKNTDEISALARETMRNPSINTKQALYKVHHVFAESFKDQSIEGLKWLRGGSSLQARGGFINAEDLKDFLNSDPKSMPSEDLASAIETLATAIGYRSIHANWTEGPFRPNTPEQKKIFNIIERAGCRKTPSIAEGYPDKIFSKVNLASDKTHREPFVEGKKRRSISPGRGDSPKTISFRQRLPSGKFFLKTPEGRFTWVGAAQKSKVPIRAHVSGSMPLGLNAIQKLAEAQENATPMTPEEMRLIAAIFIAAYERGDYHSIAETYAGFLFHQKNTLIDPQPAFVEALHLLVEASSKENKEKMEKTVENLISKTTNVPFLNQNEKTSTTRFSHIKQWCSNFLIHFKQESDHFT